MQPYFFPYLGYFQLINSVDAFVLYDNIEFTKSGWIRRNRILNNNHDRYIIVPIKKTSDYSHVRDIEIAEEFDYLKMLRVIKGAYHGAPCFKGAYAVLEDILPPKSRNLFEYISSTIKSLCAFLNIETKVHVSSTISIDHSLKAQDKVIALCNALDADEYINPIGGKALYDKHTFAKSGVKLSFLRMSKVFYHQFNDGFMPDLSIVDVMMFNSQEKIIALLDRYELI